MKTKSVALLMPLVIILALMLVSPLYSYADSMTAVSSPATLESSIEASGSVTDTITYEIDSDMVLYISGTGRIPDYKYSGRSISGDTVTVTWRGTAVPWDDYRNQITKIVIESGITYLGEYAFMSLPKLTDVEMADTVTEIGGYAFYYNTSLANVSFSSNLSTIGEYAFQLDSQLQQVMFPESLRSIEDYAFDLCGLTGTLNLNNGLTTIGNCAFYRCSSLTEIIIPDSITKLDGYMFASCNSVRKITLGKGVDYCPSFCALEEVVVSAENPYLTVVDGVVFSSDMKKIVCYPEQKQIPPIRCPME